MTVSPRKALTGLRRVASARNLRSLSSFFLVNRKNLVRIGMVHIFQQHFLFLPVILMGSALNFSSREVVGLVGRFKVENKSRTEPPEYHALS